MIPGLIFKILIGEYIVLAVVYGIDRKPFLVVYWLAAAALNWAVLKGMG